MAGRPPSAQAIGVGNDPLPLTPARSGRPRAVRFAMRPGGVFVNADDLYDGQPAIAGIAAALRRTRLGTGEERASWRRRPRGIRHAPRPKRRRAGLDLRNDNDYQYSCPLLPTPWQ
ncbi:hypothetical protein [Planomonospora alba]